MMIYFQKLFKIPGPADVGMSKNNHAMASSHFRNYPNELTWEDYFEHIKKIMPIRYFICATLPGILLSIWWSVRRPILKIISYLKSHLVPSRRFHMLDLRQPKTELNPNPYRYGWLDTDARMEYALFNLLVEYVEKELPGYGFLTEEFVKENPECKNQYDQQQEFMEIYNYWKFENPKLDHEYELALCAWSRDNKELSKKLDEMEEYSSKKLNEMLHRLIDVRHSLWT